MDIYTVFTLGAITDKAYDKGSKAIDKVCEHQCPGPRIDVCILFPWIKTRKSHAWITCEVYARLLEKLPYCLQSGGAVSHPRACVRPPGPPDSRQSAVRSWFCFRSSSGCVQVSCCGFSLHFPRDSCCKHFSCLFCFVLQCLFKYLTYFLTGLIFLLLSFENLLFILDTSPLTDGLQIFSPNVRLFFSVF